MILKDIVTYVSRGITPKYIDKNGFCVLNQKCIRNHNIDLSYSRLTILNDIQLKSAKMLKDFDILINSTGQGTLGRVAQVKHVNGHTTVDSHITILRVNDKLVNPQYVGYFLKYKEAEIELLAEGSTGQTELSKDKLINSFILPDINMQEQQHIVDTIGSVDDLIENYGQQIVKLKLFGSQLYTYKVSKNYINKSISEFNIKYGISIPSNKRNIGDYPLFASNGIVDYIDKQNAKNAIIFGCRGSIGNVFYSNESCFVLNTAFYIQDSKNYGNLYFSLVSENGLSLYATGAAQPQITISSISSVNLKFPTDNELNSILDQILNLEKEIKVLKKEKNLLLKKYFG